MRLQGGDFIARGLVALAATSLVCGGVVTFLDWSAESSRAGQMGDFWGGHIGAFANLAALLVLLATFRSQSLELARTRREFEEQRDLSRRQADETFALQLINSIRALEENIRIPVMMTGVGRAIVREGWRGVWMIFKEQGQRDPKTFPATLLNLNRKGRVLEYLRAIDYTCRWIIREPKRNRDEYFELLYVHLPPDFVGQMVDNDFLGMTDFKNSPAVQEFIKWKATSARYTY
jgi:hypothetical protein